MQSSFRKGSGILLAALCIASLAAISPAPASGADKPTLNKAPEFTAKDLTGKSVKLADLIKDGPVLIDFWTTFCKPCMNELPQLDRLHRTYRDRGFKVVALSQDDPKGVLKVKPLVTQKKWDLVVLIDTQKDVGNAFKVRAYPTSFLIDRDGEIVHFAQGYSAGDEKLLEAKVVELLGGEAGTKSSATEDSGTRK
jgi:cytochrome c biogenesis protein CcmG, thiol:disulfide interchange protein DsbE